MSWIGVITGDIINSTEILNSGNRKKLLKVLHKTVEEINTSHYCPQAKIDIYRGDSFQISVKNPASALTVSVLLRASLIANSMEDNRWDARIGIGIGKGEYIAKNVMESDGEAFRLSGKAFDSLDRNRNLAILTPDENFNDELYVNTGFADDIISNWTISQSAAIFPYILYIISQKDLAQKLDKTPQAISKLLTTGKVDLITNLEIRFAKKIDQLTP